MTALPKRFLWLIVFLVVVLGVGFTIGLTIRPGAWYHALVKPFFTPPNWLFGPAWTLIYILIAVAGWKVLVTKGPSAPTFRLWLLQMLLNWAWTPVFFGFHQIAIGLVVIACLLIAVLAFIFKSEDCLARWCFAPYALWLCYATALNAAILALN